MRPHPIARTLAAAATFAACALAALPAAGHPHEAVSTPEQVADQVMAALGGREAWDAARFFRFTFAGRRTHWWDKHSGRHRLEGKTREGDSYLVLQNVVSREGKAWWNGQPASPEKAKELLENAYGAWINDTYWLLMPYKLRDPGVHLAYVGEETVDGVKYDKLLLTFREVGLTPGDRYWAFVNHDTHLMDRWAYVLQDQDPSSPPTAWRWEGWQRYGGIMLAPRRVQVGGEGRTLELGGIEVGDSMPDELFTSPESLPAQ